MKHKILKMYVTYFSLGVSFGAPEELVDAIGKSGELWDDELVPKGFGDEDDVVCDASGWSMGRIRIL